MNFGKMFKRKKKKSNTPIHFESISDDEYLVVLSGLFVDQKNVYRILKALGKKVPKEEIEFELEKNSVRAEGVQLEQPVLKHFFEIIMGKIRWKLYVESRLPVKILSNKLVLIEFHKVNNKYRLNLEIRGVYSNIETNNIKTPNPNNSINTTKTNKE